MDNSFDADIKTNLENLSKRCDKLEKENIDYKKRLLLNQDNILNLLIQLKKMRNEYKKQIDDLKENYNQQINELKENYGQQINELKENYTKQKNIYKENSKNKNEIIIEDENDDLFAPKKLKEDIKKMIREQLHEFKNEIYLYVGNNISIGTDEKTVENIKHKSENLINIFETKLYNIFNDTNKEIPVKKLNELKKLATAILIKHKKSPLALTDEFINKNFINNSDINEVAKVNYQMKKGPILYEIGGIVQKLLNINDEQTKFLKDFREKYGIEDSDMDDKDLKKVMKKNNNNENRMIEAVLKKLKYIN